MTWATGTQSAGSTTSDVVDIPDNEFGEPARHFLVSAQSSIAGSGIHLLASNSSTGDTASVNDLFIASGNNPYSLNTAAPFLHFITDVGSTGVLLNITPLL